MRDRVAIALLGVANAICLGYAWFFAHWSLPATTIPLSFALAHAVIALGFWRRRSWARWMGAGLAISAALFSIQLQRIGYYFEPALRVLLVLAPVPLFLALCRNDGTPIRARASWMLAGAVLLPTLFIGLDAFFVTRLHGNANPLALVAVSLALAGSVGLARGRTWGLCATSFGGVILFFAMPSAPVWGGIVMLNTREVIRAAGVGLACVWLPFAMPMLRYAQRAS